MSKRGRRNYSASRHGKGAGKKIFAILLALVFIGTAVACGFGWWKVVKLNEQIKQLTPAEGEGNGGEEGNAKPENLIISIVEDEDYSPILLSVENSSEDGATAGNTITAVVYDADGNPLENEQVEFSLSWNGEKSEPVSDFITMEVFGNSAQFYSSGFDTQILVTCTSVSDPTKFVTATIDYVKTVSYITANFNANSNAEIVTIYNGDSCPSVKSKWTYAGSYNDDPWLDKAMCPYVGVGFSGIGSVENVVSDVTVNISLSDSVKYYLKDNALGDNNQIYTLLNVTSNTVVCPTYFIEGLFNDLALEYLNGSDNEWNDFKQVLLKTSNQFLIEYNLNLCYGRTVTIYCTLDVDFSDYVGDVQVDNNEIYLGA